MNFDTLDMDVNLILDKHFSAGRGGKDVDCIGIHYNAGNLTVEGCYSVWQTRKASAHIQVESSGRSGQLVWDSDTAWALGNFDANQRAINIEHANMADGMITEACLDTGSHIVAAYCKAFGLGRPEWLVNVFPHKYFAATACPGQIYGSQKDAYIQRAQYWYDVMTGAISPEPEKPATPLPDVLKAYTDLDPDAWYIPAVEECVREGYMHGYSATTFGPSDALTRGQAVCVLANAARADLTDYLEPFADVDANPFYYVPLVWAVDKGYVDDEQDKFRPDDAATRAEMLSFLWRWQGEPKPVGEPAGYSDWDETPDYAKDAIAWCVEQDIINGNGDKIRPTDPCTRAEAATMVANMM